MTNEDREFAEFLAKLQNKVEEIRKDFNKLSDKNKIKVQKMIKVDTTLNIGNIWNFISNYAISFISICNSNY